MIRDVTDLKVYNDSFKLLPRLYKLIRQLPNDEYNLKSQAKRAGNSIPSLIAEGFAKRYAEKGFKRYLKMALGSSDELISHLRVAAIAVPELKPAAKLLAEDYKVLAKQINSLCTNWRS